MDLVNIAAPAQAEILALVPVATIKAEQRFLSTSEDAIIEDFIVQAYQWFDGPHGWLRRAILPQQWTYYRGDFPRQQVRPMFPYPFLTDAAAPFQIPMPPLASVQSVTYVDDTGTMQTVDPSVYQVVNSDVDFGMIAQAFGQSWPVFTPKNRAVAVNFTAGYADAAHVPAPIIRGIRFLANAFFMNRTPTFEDTRVTTIDRRIVFGIEAIAGRYRFMNDLVESF